MARVPAIEGRQVQLAGTGAQGFSMRAPDVSGLTRGLEQAENGVMREVQKQREEAETAQVKEAARAYDEYEQDLKFNPETGLYTRKGKNAADITNIGTAELDTKYDEIASGIQNERVKKRFDDYRLAKRAQFGQEFNRYEFQQNQVYKDEVDAGSLETTLQGAALYYNQPEKIAQYQQQAAALVKSRAQRKGTAEELTQAELLKTNSSMMTGVIQRLANDDPYKAKSYFEQQQGGMTAEDQVRVDNLISREIKSREIEAKQLQAIGRAELSSRVSDASAAYLSGFDYENPPSQAEFIAGYGAEDGAKRYEQFVKAQGLGRAIQSIASASPEERQQIINDFNPAKDGVASAGFQQDAKLYGTLINAASRLGSEMQSDPAQYVAARSQIVKRAAQGLSSGDPADADAYANATIAEQQRLGVASPKLLTDNQAASIAASFSNTTDGGDNAAKMIEQLQGQWGKHWPQVFSQLQGKLPGAALVIGTGVDQQTASTLARIAPIKTADLKKGLDSTDTTEAKRTLNDRFAEFRNTLAGQAGGERTFTTLYDEAERLTYAYMRQGKSYADAAELATKSLIDDKYTIKGSWRAPKQLDADIIEDGAEKFIDAIDPSTIAFAVPSGVSEDFAKERVKAALSKDAYWVTAPDESGLALYYGGGAVLDKEGNPIIQGWDDLAGESAKVPSLFDRFNEGREKMINAEKQRLSGQGAEQ
ncbi:hypothetical protein [Pseudomonas segetis]|uniref:Uncharacterized protein n=1 Tax=Pseudomonas segetis TaxID=298908 RepID=A0A239C6L8_9PSED|nr:hypothetical protein [Pseudomonas segetis]SNS15760.1 hypothetical protein SAMN05216255_1536 [Pseudomonas segetis]